MKLFLLSTLALVLTVAVAPAAKPKAAPNFTEVSELLRAHLPGVTEAELQRAAAQGWVNYFKGRVLLGGAALTNAPAKVTEAKVFENGFAYLRFTAVGPGLAENLAQAFRPLAATNKVRGLVLDARYVGGSDYAAAAAVADLFIGSERPLLDWGAGRAGSTEKEQPIAVPVTVLINGQTRGAGEALAAVLRQTGAGLLIGSRTAGEAGVFKEFKLSDGQKLRIAIGPVTLGNGEALPVKGLTPDVTVKVSAADERAYFADPYKIIATETAPPVALSTNAPRRRINEAELVRLQREGNLPPEDQPFPATTDRPNFDPVKSELHDPALARAVDLLKALAIVRPTRAL